MPGETGRKEKEWSKKTAGAIEAILFAMGGSVELKKLAQAIGHDEETTKK